MRDKSGEISAQIGIFWIKDDDELILDTCPYDQGEDLIGNWVNHSGHHPFWEQYAASQGITQDYTYFTRGRVVYNKKTGQFKIMASKKVIHSKKIIAKIAKAFSLTKYKLSADAHYEDAFQLLDE